LTKGALMKLFAITSKEADGLHARLTHGGEGAATSSTVETHFRP
jgi:hypothetical protein